MGVSQEAGTWRDTHPEVNECKPVTTVVAQLLVAEEVSRSEGLVHPRGSQIFEQFRLRLSSAEPI